MFLLSKIILIISISFLLACTKISPDASSTEHDHSTSATQTEGGEEEGDESDGDDDDDDDDDDTSKDDDTGEKTDTTPEEETYVPSEEETEILEAEKAYKQIYSEITKINDEISNEEGGSEDRETNQRSSFMDDLVKHKDDPEKEVVEAQLALLDARYQLSQVVLENLRKISQAANDLQDLSKFYVDFLTAKKNGTPFINNQYPKTPRKSLLGKAIKTVRRSFDNHVSTHQQRKNRIKKSISRAQEAYENAKKAKESDLETYKKMIVEAEASLEQLLEKHPNYGNFSQT